MLCSRCNFELGELAFGWTNCPKCGLAKFIPGESKPSEKEVEEGQEAVGVEEKKNNDSETVEEDQE